MKFKMKLVEDIEDIDIEVEEETPSVKPGIHFIEDGLEYEWVEAKGERVYLELDCWQVWSAKEFLTQQVKYFVVDPDISFIDWGPCDTEQEAQEFLEGKIADYEEDEEEWEDIEDMDLEDQFTHLMKEVPLTEATAKSFEFTYSVDGTSYTTTIQAPSMIDAEQQIKDSHQGKNCYITSKKEVVSNDNNSNTAGSSGDSNSNKQVKESLEIVTDEILPELGTQSVIEISDTDDKETPQPPTVGQDMGTANLLNQLIIDEWEAIDGYNNAIATLSSLSTTSAEPIIKVITDIVNEEHIHVGQLQKALELVAPNAVSIGNGEQEATEQIDSEENVQ